MVIGSRESKLAVIQSEMVLHYIEENYPNMACSLLTMKTTGDIILDKTLDKIGGKGLFVKELDRALLAKKSDISVHSLKDMPMEVPEELPLIGYSKREDPRDVLILPKGTDKLQFEKPIGCSSMRRVLQLKSLYPQAEFKSIRGNVITRLEKLDNGEYSGLVLAAAGIKRLGLEDRIHKFFTIEEILPAAGQGILALQGRKEEEYDFLSGFCNEESYYMATAERAFVRTLDGGCSSPIAAHAVIKEEKITLYGLYYDEESKRYHKDDIVGALEEAETLGKVLAKKMKDLEK